MEDLKAENIRLKAEMENLKIVDKYRTSPTPWLSAELVRLEKDRDAWKSKASKLAEALRIIETATIVLQPAIAGKAKAALADYEKECPMVMKCLDGMPTCKRCKDNFEVGKTHWHCGEHK